MRKLTIILGGFLILQCIPSISWAQSLKDMFNKENIEKVVGTISGVNIASIEGSWKYSGAAIEFESDNLLSKAGGAVAAKTAENKLNEQLTKIGLEEGKFAFTFNADSTFTIRLKDKDLHGSYSYDSSNKRINLKLLKLVGLNAKVNCTSTNLELLFNFDKLLDLITLLTSKGSNTLQTINSLAESYDGMMMGFAFCKEGQ